MAYEALSTRLGEQTFFFENRWFFRTLYNSFFFHFVISSILLFFHCTHLHFPFYAGQVVWMHCFLGMPFLLFKLYL